MPRSRSSMNAFDAGVLSPATRYWGPWFPDVNRELCSAIRFRCGGVDRADRNPERTPMPSRNALLLTTGLAAACAGLLVASDHQDSPDVELNPASDMTDVYAFPSPTAGRIVLVMNSRPFLTPAQSGSASFDKNLLYQFKVDNNGDAVEDKVIQVTFS